VDESAELNHVAFDALAELPTGNGQNVLVVDDEEAIRQLTRQTLESYGYRTVGASNGAEALLVVRASDPAVDLVITDMMMPVMDGAALAADLVRSKPDLIVAVAAQAARAAKDATSDIPIVMLYVGDPVGLGFAASLAKPGGNMTGVTALVPGDFIGKMLGILREALPQVKRLAIVMNPLNPNHQRLYPETLTPAIMLGFQLDRFEVREADGVPAAVAAAKAEGAEALYIFADVIFAFPPNRLPDLAAQAGLPSMGLEPSFARGGGLMAYGPDFLALTRRGADYVDQILKGAKAGELPIEQPSKFLTVINLKTAKSLGLEIPPALLAQADEVIE